MSLLKRYSLEWKEDPTSRDEPLRSEAPGQRGACCPPSLSSPSFSPFLVSFLATLHTVSGNLRLNEKKKVSITGHSH